MKLLLHTTKNGFPASRSDLHDSISRYWCIRKELWHQDDVVYFGDRLVMPEKFRKDVLDILHVAHQGTSGMILRASKSLYWPGMNSDIQDR